MNEQQIFHYIKNGEIDQGYPVDQQYRQQNESDLNFEKMSSSFNQLLVKDIEILQTHVISLSIKNIQLVAHRLKGPSTYMGFNHLKETLDNMQLPLKKLFTKYEEDEIKEDIKVIKFLYEIYVCVYYELLQV